MATCGEWIMKSARIGASLGAVAGFFYGTYIMATSHALSWDRCIRHDGVRCRCACNRGHDR